LIELPQRPAHRTEQRIGLGPEIEVAAGILVEGEQSRGVPCPRSQVVLGDLVIEATDRRDRNV
jgi:hypothetical protein